MQRIIHGKFGFLLKVNHDTVINKNSGYPATVFVMATRKIVIVLAE